MLSNNSPGHWAVHYRKASSPIVNSPNINVLLLKLYFSPSTGTEESLTDSTTVGVAVAGSAVVVFIAGVLVGVVLYHCVSKHRTQRSKPESSSQQQQQLSSQQRPQALSSGPLQQTGPEYDEVVKLRQNKAYELTQTGVEMQVNQAYRPV